MRKLLITLFIVSMFFTYNCFAGEVFTADQVKQIISKACKTDKKSVCLTDEVYETYILTRALMQADCTNHIYKSNLYDCEDIANSIRSIVIRHIAEQNASGGAVMFGTAIISYPKEGGYHNVNIFINSKKDVYIYDYQKATMDNLIQTPDYYLKKKIIFELIQM